MEEVYDDFVVSSGEYAAEFRVPSKKRVKKYECGICGLKCSSPSTLEVHMRTHTGEKPFGCTLCDYRCAQQHAIKAHMRVHTGERPFACTECDYRAAHSSMLKIHMRKHTGEKPYACPYCTYKTATNLCLKQHLTKHTNEKPYKCPQCDARFRSYIGMRNHKFSHSKVLPFRCTQCNFQAPNKNRLDSHFRIHTGEKPFKCPHCNHRTRLKTSMVVHIRGHTGERPYPCRFCDYRASATTVLKVHERLHTGEKPYTCRICSKNFISNNVLKDHMKEHSTEKQKPFPCFLCDDRFERPVEWMEHLASHGSGDSGLKKYTCDQCSYTTYRKGNLGIHKSFKHVTDKPWDCMFCEAKFPKKSNMRRHIHQYHSDLVGDAHRQRALVKAARPSKTERGVRPEKSETERAADSVLGGGGYISESGDAEYMVHTELTRTSATDDPTIARRLRITADGEIVEDSEGHSDAETMAAQQLITIRDDKKNVETVELIQHIVDSSDQEAVTGEIIFDGSEHADGEYLILN